MNEWMVREHEKWKKRELVLEEQRLNKRIKKSLKEKEQENREEGMQKVLDSSNKVNSELDSTILYVDCITSTFMTDKNVYNFVLMFYESPCKISDLV